MNLVSKKIHTIKFVNMFIFLRSFNKSVIRCRIFLFLFLWCWPSNFWLSWLIRLRFCFVMFIWKLRFLRDCGSTSPVFTAADFLIVFLFLLFLLLSCFVHSFNILVWSVCECRLLVSVIVFGKDFWGKGTFFNPIILFKVFLLFNFVLFVLLPKLVSFKQVHLS